MRRIAFVAVMLMGVLTIASCAKVDEFFKGKTETITFVASFADETRTSYQGEGKVDWVSGDIIRYYSRKNGQIDEYEVVKNGHSANVTAYVASGTEYIVAAYGGESITDNAVNSFTINGAIKAEQNGKFEDAHVSVSKNFNIEDGASLAFHNMTSLIKFTIERTDVSYITFTANGGEKIHGDGMLKITFEDDKPYAAFGDNGGSSIKVNTDGAGSYYISTLPVELSKGFEIKYFDSIDKMIANTFYCKAFVIKSDELVNLGTLDRRMESYSGFDYVDLGLSVKWATCNVGASRPEENGEYYQWGGIKDVTDKYLSWNYCPHHNGTSSDSGWVKYNYQPSLGTVDNKNVLQHRDDAAYAKLGGNWRMPTDTEWEELVNKCTWTWTKYNGVYGCKITSKISGFTSNYIFLPATGYYADQYLYESGSIGHYWASTLDITNTVRANALDFTPDHVFIRASIYSYRYYGLSVRPVYDENIFAEISLSNIEISICKGDVFVLSASVESNKDIEPELIWSSSDNSVVKVDNNGKLEAIGAGTATITVKLKNGFTAVETCFVTVLDPDKFDGVDLGLSVKWASCNLGATKPEDYGGYYQWGGLQDVTSTSLDINVSNCPYHTGSSYSTGWTKYVQSSNSSYWSGSGNPDNKTVLDPEDDIAHVKLGGERRMPTRLEWDELMGNCRIVVTTRNGVKGLKLTSKKNGNSIFLPAAGYRRGENFGDAGYYGHYWSSSLTPYYSNCACSYVFISSSANINTYDYYRCDGFSVRPVSD